MTLSNNGMTQTTFSDSPLLTQNKDGLCSVLVSNTRLSFWQNFSKDSTNFCCINYDAIETLIKEVQILSYCISVFNEISYNKS